MANCKCCGSNDRKRVKGYLECQHCGGRVKLKSKKISTGKYDGGFGFLTTIDPLLDNYLGYQNSPVRPFIKLQS